MKYDRKKYTFEDWKAGKPINGRNGKVYNDIRLALLDTLAGFDDIIDDSEYSKIKKMQEIAFNKACEINFYFNKKDLHRSIEKVKEEALISPEEKLNDKVKEIEQYIESNQKLKESVSQGAKDYRFISYKKCLEVDEAYNRLESMQSKWIGFSIPTEGKKAKPSEKLLMKERLLMLKYINENREKILGNLETNIIQEWKEKGRLSDKEQIECVVDIATKKNISQEDAFRMVLKEGIYMGRKSKYTSWQKANTRLNKRKK